MSTNNLIVFFWFLKMYLTKFFYLFLFFTEMRRMQKYAGMNTIYTYIKLFTLSFQLYF